VKTVTHYPTKDEVKQFAWLCIYIENMGNGKGMYRIFGMHDNLHWLSKAWSKPLRDGIIFYSTGWGWRLRKKPAWHVVFAERFGANVLSDCYAEKERERKQYGDIPF